MFDYLCWIIGNVLHVLADWFISLATHCHLGISRYMNLEWLCWDLHPCFLHGACGFGDVGDCKMLSYQLSIAIGIIGTPIHSSYYLHRFAELSCFVEFCDFYNMPFPLNTSENTSRTVEGGGDSFPAGDLGRRRRFESYSSWHSLERPWFSFDTEAFLSDSGSKSSAAVQTPEAAVRTTGDKRWGEVRTTREGRSRGEAAEQRWPHGWGPPETGCGGRRGRRHGHGGRCRWGAERRRGGGPPPRVSRRAAAPRRGLLHATKVPLLLCSGAVRRPRFPTKP